MTGDERFERDLRAALDDLAGEPAPERLVDRVAGIPAQPALASSYPTRLRLAARGVGSGLGLIAAGVAIAILAVAIRQGGGVGPAASGGPLGGGAGASPASGGSPASSASTVVHPSPVPAGFEPLSATFVSADDGWVLGSAPCGSGRCAAVARTADGGATWSAVPAPATLVGTVGGGPANAGVSSVRFADRLNGWAFGPELWATHDGGATWRREAISGLPADAPLMALETAAGAVHAVAYDLARDFRIASAGIGADDWRLAPGRVPVGGGPVPQIDLVLAGRAGWIVENDRTVVAGARLQAGAWRAWQPPCLDVVGPGVLAAADEQTLVAACAVGAMAEPQGVHLFESTDAGTSFGETGSRAPLDSVAGVAFPVHATVVAAGENRQGAVIVGSFDGGRTWRNLIPAVPGSFADLGFTTPDQGIVVVAEGNGTSVLLMTRDGGQTWAPVGF